MLASVSHADAARIYEVRAETPQGRVHAFGARRSRDDAEALLHATSERVGKRNSRYWIEEIDTTELFQPPSTPTPRDRYTTRVTSTTKPGTGQTVHVEVVDGEAVIASYDRNYSMLHTFEPSDRVTASSH